jgi:hypothetical protein
VGRNACPSATVVNSQSVGKRRDRATMQRSTPWEYVEQGDLVSGQSYQDLQKIPVSVPFAFKSLRVAETAGKAGTIRGSLAGWRSGT